MGYNHDTERRIDAALKAYPRALAERFSKKKMFGGLAYLYSGKMTIGVVKDDLMVRLLSGKMEEVLQNPNVRPMDFTGRAMKEFVYVSPGDFATEQQLFNWIEMGLEHARHTLKEI